MSPHVQPRCHGLLSSSPVGTRLIYRPRVLGSVFSGGEGEGAGERLSHFPKGQLVTILEDFITYIYTLSSYPRWSFGVFLWELFTLGKLASSSSSFFLLYRWPQWCSINFWNHDNFCWSYCVWNQNHSRYRQPNETLNADEKSAFFISQLWKKTRRVFVTKRSESWDLLSATLTNSWRFGWVFSWKTSLQTFSLILLFDFKVAVPTQAYPPRKYITSSWQEIEWINQWIVLKSCK